MALSQEVDIVFAQSLHYFPNSAQLHVFIAQYIRYFLRNEHLELMHLSAADVRGRDVVRCYRCRCGSALRCGAGVTATPHTHTHR